MTTDRIAALEALLARPSGPRRLRDDGAERRLRRAVATVVREYAVEHGIGAIVGHEVSPDDLAELLTASWSELQETDPRPAEPWTTFIARRLAAEL